MMTKKPGFSLQGLGDQVSMPVPDILSPTKDVGDKYRGTRQHVRNQVSLLFACYYDLEKEDSKKKWGILHFA